MSNAKRKPSKTSLIYGEGVDEKRLGDYFKGLYKRSGIKFHCEAGSGGSSVHVVNSAKKFCSNKAYDYKVVVFDGDCETTNEAINLAEKNKFIPIVFNPCLEGMLLELLGMSVSDSSRCGPNKSALIAKLGDAIHNLSTSSLERHFPKDGVEQYAKNITKPNSIALCKLLTESQMLK